MRYDWLNPRFLSIVLRFSAKCPVVVKRVAIMVLAMLVSVAAGSGAVVQASTASSQGAIAVEDSVAPALNRDIPFGQLLPGFMRTEHITIRNTDPLNNLTVNGVFLQGAPSGTIQGNIKDDSGANAPEVLVSVSPGDYKVSTDPDGNYTLFNLAVGVYMLSISKPGHESQSRLGVVVNRGETTTENFTIVSVMNDAMPGGVNLALQATQWPTDSNFSSDYAGNKARDSVVSVTSKWCSSNQNSTHWLAYDLGAVRLVHGFVIQHAGAAGEPTTYNTKQFSFQRGASINGPWTDDNIVDNSAQASITTRTYHQPRNTRYVRLYITNSGIDKYARIPEFEVWGDPTPAAEANAVPGGIIAGAPLASANSFDANEPPELSITAQLQRPHLPDTLLVGFDRSEVTVLRQSAHIQLGTTKLRSFRSIPVDVIQIPKGADIQKVMAAYKRIPGVKFVEPNYEIKIQATANDPSFGQQWALHNTGQNLGTPGADINALGAWSTTVGNPSVVVGIVDTGIKYTHPELAQNMWVNPNPTFGDIYGARWTNGTGVPTSGDPMDDNGHGTHVAGIIGAVGNNGVGVAGVNWNVRLMALKFLGSGGTGSTADAIAALQYAVDHGVKITNNSWSGGGQSQALTNMVRSAASAGQLVMAAAGNDGVNTDITPRYPAGCDSDNVISVGSSDNKDQRSLFGSNSSNWGSTTVDLCAPGSNILSTYTLSPYATLSGTSMATPFVTGTASLMMSLNPWASYQNIKSWIMQTVDKIPAWTGLSVTGGRLNAAAAIRLCHPHFRLTNTPALPATIAPGGSIQVDVLYAPLGLGNHADIVRIESSSAVEAAVEVTLSGSCVSAIAPSTIDAIKFMPDNAMVALDAAIVSAVWPGVFYVTANDRSSGIRVESVGHGLTPGFRAKIVGRIRTNSDGERFIEALSAVKNGTGAVAPLGMKNSGLGGEDWLQAETLIGQQGVADAFGLNNIGLLIRTWGRVVQITGDGLYIDDGSVAGGLRVICDPSAYQSGDYLSVTGICSCYKTLSGSIARRVLTQGPASLVKLNI